ncbi:MAG: hypothetical protein FWH15_00415 [Betaproteobacteria bacterium]|nr:hypothetical protein [Betaproteobacteria bacterium]
MLYSYISDPHYTKLPVGTTDLTSVQEKLAKLSADERALVQAYVRRSSVTVLSPQFTDPTDSLPARTFGEAIKLQRAWGAKMAAANRETALGSAKFAPLRAVVQAIAVKVEAIPHSEYQGRLSSSDNIAIIATLVRVQNLGGDAIIALRGTLKAVYSESLLSIPLCWFYESDQLALAVPKDGDIELTFERRSSLSEGDSITNSTKGRFRVVWEPTYVKFADGHELKIVWQ